MSDILLKQKKLELLKKQKELRQCLPHLYGFPWYKWSREFFECTNKNAFLVAANQVSKSSTHLRKCIHWATETSLWKELWPHCRPLVFWYLYPTKEVATIEFEKKWVPEFLPRGPLKESGKYAWREEKKQGFIQAIHFESGVSVYFKTYGTDAQNLQSGTCAAVLADEEMPFDLYPELNMRRSATDGYFSMVFTATLGQDEWRRTMQPEPGETELFPDAAKWQVSKWDCLFYEDGTPSPWTKERIEREIALCGTEAEVNRRILGRFAVAEGLKYPHFSRARHVKPGHPVPADWAIYAGVDIGSGGEENHPAAITFIAVAPDYRRARVIRSWRGDGIQTSAEDVLRKYQELRGDWSVNRAFYDFASKEFGIIAARNGESFEPAEKSHEIGEKILNILFKNDLIAIYDYPEHLPLITELQTLKHSTKKTKAHDDAIDSLRYSASSVPWDWTFVSGRMQIQKPKDPPTQEELRRQECDPREVESYLLNGEFDEINDLYEGTDTWT